MNNGFTFNGVKKPYVTTVKKERPVFAPLKRNLLYLPGMPGAHLESTTTEVRVQPVTIWVDSEGYSSLEKLKEDMAAWLVTDQAAELVFDDDIDRIYYAAVDGTLNLEEIVTVGHGVITFICPDPYKYGPEKKVNGPFQEVSKADFVGKVSGSAAENPHVAKHNALRATTGLLTPQTMPEEFSNNGYSGISTLNGGLATVQTTANLSQGQELFSFNLIALIERKYGLIPAFDLAGKVEWLKANITKLTANWHGKGSNKHPTPIGKADFVGKVAGSTVENPHVLKGARTTSLANTNPATAQESGQQHYDAVKTLNGITSIGWNTTVNGEIAQHVFSFNLIEYIKRKYGKDVPGATTADKVAWLKTNLTKLTCNWHGKGSGPAGNKATIVFFNNGAWDSNPGWSTVASSTSGAITKLSPWVDGGNVGTRIDSNGFIHLLAYADASNGVIASTIETDFVELEVELIAGENKANFKFYSNKTGSVGWQANYSHPNATVTKISVVLTNTDFNYWELIGSDGFAHLLAHAPASNGIAASTIETDYIELEIEAKIPYLPITLINEGSAETYPVIKAEVLKPVTVLDILAEDSYMRVGRPVDLSEVVFTEKELLSKDTLASTVGWTNGTAIDGGLVAGSMVSDGNAFIVSSYGSGPEWHGPALKKSLPQVIQNYRIEFWFEFKPVPGTTGRVELYLLDASGAKIGKLTLRDTWKNSTIVVSDIEAAGKILNSGPYEQDKLAWNDFYGLMMIEKKGDVFSFYTTEVDPVTGRHYNARGTSYTDYEGILTQSLAALQIHAGQYGTEPPVSLKFHELTVYKINLPGSNQIPYIANTGDIIEIDFNTDDIRINGESRIDLKDFGASYFPIKRGENKMTFLPFDAFKTEIVYQERYK